MSTKVYLQDNQIKLVQSIASASTIISTLCGEVKQFIIKKFPPNYFRHIHMDTGTASHLINVNRNYNQKLHKIPYPNLTIETALSIDSPINGTETDVNHAVPNMYMRRDLNSYYQKILFDPNEKFAMYYTTQFITCNFNFKINVNSFIQMTDLVYFLKEELHLGIFQYLNSRPIMTEIPKTFISIISTLLGYDLNDPDHLDDLSLYLIRTSRKNDGIRRKVNNTTGKICFMLNDLTDLITVVDDLDAPGGISRDGQVEGEYTIVFRVQVIAPVANQFILSIDKDKFKKIADDVTLTDEIFNSKEDNVNTQVMTTSIIEARTVVDKETIEFFDANQLSSPSDERGDPHIGVKLFKEVFSLPGNSKSFHLNLKEMLKDLLLNTHAYMIAKHLEPTSLLYFRVFDVNGERTDCSIDYNKLELDLEGIDSDVVVIGYADRAVYEAIETARETDKEYFNDNFLWSLCLKVPSAEGKLVDKYAVVKRFVDENEEYSTDVNKCLRVATPYGIGYVYLVHEDDPQASNVKICVGEDKFLHKVPLYDENGKLMHDENGEILYETEKDADGNVITDENGNPKYVERGNPIIRALVLLDEIEE